ncbi:MAG: PKD domain-containing protein, partial [Bacteroidia bacterium]|nr:PKD domain-containing protein [Bacteroidia bacterium]
MTRRVLFNSIFLFAIFLLAGTNLNAQNFSNKGNEFWTCFPLHCDEGTASIQLILSSDKETFVWVDLFGTGNYVAKNGTVSTVPTVHNIKPNIPYVIGPISNPSVYLGNVTATNSPLVSNKAIRIRTLSTNMPPFVVYSHIYSSNQSDAALVLPVSTLGRDYYAASYACNPICLVKSGGFGACSQGPQRNFIAIMAIEPGSTVVNITLPPGFPVNGVSIGTGNAPGTSSSFSVTLNQGQIYQLLSGSSANTSNGLDLTGTRIQSISTVPGQCKRIAVYSGGSRVMIGGGSCTTPGSGDNLYEMMYPTSTWGKNFVIPPVIGRTGNGAYTIVRVIASKDTTSIVVNGAAPVMKNAGQYLELNVNSVQSITANKPISIAQYYVSSNCGGGPGIGTGDPSTIMWSPLEQILKNCVIYSSSLYQIAQSYIQIVTKTSDTSKLTLDNNKVAFTVASTNTAYSYANIPVTSGSAANPTPGNHVLKSDSGFTAVSYGWGPAESYGYSSGANIKNLNQFITASVDSGCVGNPVTFLGTAVYAPTSWKWYFGDGTNATTQNAVKTYSTPGKYWVSLVTVIPGGLDCDSQDSTSVEFTINAKPVANFAWQKNCVNDTIRFADSSNTATSFVNKWYWQFGDGDTSTQKNPKHKYATHGTYQVKLKIFNEGGCDDSITKTVTIYPSPKANFYTPQHCVTDSFNFLDSSTIATGGVINFWQWKFGTGDSSMAQYPKYKFITEGTGNISLIVQSDFGCIDSVRKSVSIDPTPDAKLWSQSVCRNDSAVFLDSSNIVAGSITNWLWKFGDGDSSILTNPKHKYASPGTYTYRLTVTSDKACWDTASSTLQVYTLPAAGFKPTSVCNKDSIHFEDQSLGGGTGTPAHWSWDFGDGSSVDTVDKPVHYYVNAGPYQVKMIVTNNFGCRDTLTKTVKVYPKHKAAFTIGILCNIDTSFFINKSSI